MKKYDPQLIVFSDLDGTLIDYHTYSYKKTLPAIKKLKKKEIPLIICSSKTRKEIEFFIKKLNILHPFVSENGGAIFIPKGYFSKWNFYSKELDNYQVIELGTSYEVLRNKLKEISKNLGIEIIGFGDMSVKEVVKETGLDISMAHLAKEREYDEPFKFIGEIPKKKIIEFREELKKNGTKLARGGRFFHLMGKNDKGKAVKTLTRLYMLELEKKIISIGIGDSMNDLPMLKACKEAIIVKGPTGSYDGEVMDKMSQEIILADGIGPVGWKKAVLKF